MIELCAHNSWAIYKIYNDLTYLKLRHLTLSGSGYSKRYHTIRSSLAHLSMKSQHEQGQSKPVLDIKKKANQGQYVPGQSMPGQSSASRPIPAMERYPPPSNTHLIHAIPPSPRDPNEPADPNEPKAGLEYLHDLEHILDRVETDLNKLIDVVGQARRGSEMVPFQLNHMMDQLNKSVQMLGHARRVARMIACTDPLG